MSQVPTDPRLRYLEDAAQLLLATSPAASAHIQSICDTGLDSEIAESKSQYRSCAACGSILVLGWSCKKQITRPKRRTRSDNETGRTEPKSFSLQCTRCNLTSRFNLRKSPKDASRKAPVAQSQSAPPKPRAPTVNPTDERLDTPAIPSPITDSGAKRRGRNKKSSLQSLLANKPSGSHAAPAGGFDLMDFMKK